MGGFRCMLMWPNAQGLLSTAWAAMRARAGNALRTVVKLAPWRHFSWAAIARFGSHSTLGPYQVSLNHVLTSSVRVCARPSRQRHTPPHPSAQAVEATAHGGADGEGANGAVAAAVDSATVGPAVVDPATVGPATVGPATVGPVTVGPATVGPATVGPETVGPETVGLGPHDAAGGAPARCRCVRSGGGKLGSR